MNAKRYAPILLVVLPGGLVAAAGIFAWRAWRRRARVRDLTVQLQTSFAQLEQTAPRSGDRLVAGLARIYAAELAAAAVATSPADVDPERWAFFFAGVIARESGFGAYLTPRGPNGLGDGGHGHGLGQVDDRWNEAEPEISALRLQHIESGDWTDPEKHLLFCAELLRRLWDQLEQLNLEDERLQATAAAYNAGAPRVLALLAQGLSPDSATTGGNYGADVLTRADTFNLAANDAAASSEIA